MKIETIRDLDKVIALCRKRGISAIKIDNIEFALDASTPVRANKTKAEQSHNFTSHAISAETKIDLPDELTEDQLLFYSAAGTSEPQP